MAFDEDAKPVVRRRRRRRRRRTTPVRGEQSYGTPKTPPRPKSKPPSRARARDSGEAARFTRSRDYDERYRRDQERALRLLISSLRRDHPRPKTPVPFGERYTGRRITDPKPRTTESWIDWYNREVQRRHRTGLFELGATPQQVSASMAGKKPLADTSQLPRLQPFVPPPDKPGWADRLAEALLVVGSGDAPTYEARERARANPAVGELASTIETVAKGGEMLIGPDTIRMLSGGDYNPAMVGLEIGSLFTGPIRAPAAIVRGLRTALSGRGARAAVGAAREAHAVPNVLPRAAQRVFRVGALDIRIPAAGSRIGRGAERLADALRPYISAATRGKYKSVAAKGGEELNRTVRYYQRQFTAHSNAIRMLGRKLNPTQQAAIRLSLEQVTPEEYAVARRQWIQEATEAGDKETVVYLKRHAGLEEEARVYLDTGPEGRVVGLRADAPKKMHEFERIYRSGVELREKALSDIGRLDGERAARRAIETARIVRGARYMTNEQQVAKALADDPGRQIHFETVDLLISDPKQAQAIKDMWDAAALSMARRMHGETWKKDPTAALQPGLGRFVGSEPISEEKAWELLQDTGLGALRYETTDLMQKAPLPERLPSDEIAQRILAEGHPLPPELQTPEGLAAAIDRVYALAQESAGVRDWYTRAGTMARVIAGQEGITADQSAQLLAIYSQASGTIPNVKFVLDAVRQFKETGAVTSVGRFPKRQAAEATAVLKGEKWAGRKRSSFYMNIIEEADPAEAARLGVDANAVTVDRWVVRMFAPESGKDVPGAWYDGMERIVQEMARPLGWKPKEIQAASWVTMKGQSLAERYPLWPSPKVRREAADAFERGFEEHGAQQRLFGPGLAPEEKPYRGKGVPTAKIPASLNEAAANTRTPDGGFTLDAFLRPYRGDGYAVSIPGHEEIVPVEEVTAQRIAAYAKSKQAQLAEDDKLYIGGWHNPEDGQVYLDLSKIVDDRTTAINLARAGQQDAIFHFGTGTVIPASGRHVGEDAAKAYDELLDRAARQFLGAKGKRIGKRQREQAQFLLDEWADKNPEHEMSRLYNELSLESAEARAARMPDPDSVEFKERYWGAREFGEEARKDLEDYQALARDIARTLPEEEHPQWVKNALRPRQEPVKFPEGADVSPMDRPVRPEATGARRRYVTSEIRRLEGYTFLGKKETARLEKLRRELEDRPTGKPEEEEWSTLWPESKPPDEGEEWSTLWASSQKLQSYNYYRELVKNADPEVLRALTEAPTPSSIIRAARVALEKGDIEAASRLGQEIEPLLAREGKTVEGIFTVFVPKGVTDPAELEKFKSSMIGFVTGKADLATFIHEHAHFLRAFALMPHEENRVARWAGAEPIGEMGDFGIPSGGWKWSKEAEEKFATGIERWMMDAEGPEGLKGAAYTIAKAMRHIHDEKGPRPHWADDVPPHVAKVFRNLFRPGKVSRGGKVVGEEALERPGAVRVPLVRGVPLTADTRAVRSVMTTNSRLFGAGRKQAVGAGPDDIHLRKAYKGSLMMSGFHLTDIAEPMARDLVVAGRMAASHFVRKKLLEAGTELPTAIDDVAVKIDPKKDASPKLAALFDKLDSLDKAGVDFNSVKGISGEMAEAFKEAALPGTIMMDGVPVDARIAAAAAIDSQEPIDNIVWVNREFIDQSGLLYTPKGRRRGPGKKGEELGLLGLDTLNDMQRVSILYLNPSYIPVNFAGNAVMNLFQQGVFLPRNAWRAAKMHRDMDYLQRNMVDAYMGTGLTGSLMGKTAMMKGVNATLGHWIQLATDLIPRRAAFLHEARRAGYKTKKQVNELLEKGWSEELEHIVRKANDAIVDFERMSPFEREVLTRAIFVYPWLKGASRYTARFAFEHPIQAAALLMLGEHAWHTSEERLGDRPFFAESVVPIGTETVGANLPGVGRVSLADVVGDKTWEDRGMPMAFDVRQVLTFTTPAQLIQTAIGFFTGSKDAPALVEALVPVVGAAIVASTGYDPFLEREVPRGAGTFAKQLADIPLKQRYEQIFMSDEERKDYHERALRPRTREQEIWRAVGGGLAPAPYSTEIGAERAREKLSTVERNKIELAEESEEAGLGKPPAKVFEDMEWYYRLEGELKSGMTSKEKADIVARLYDERHKTGGEMAKAVNRVRTQGEAEAIYDELRPHLYPWYTAWNREVDKILDAQGQRQPVGR